jgi:hypothetical protein
MEGDNLKQRRKLEDFLRNSSEETIISLGNIFGFKVDSEKGVDVKKIRRKIEDAVRKNDKLMQSLATVLREGQKLSG